MAFPSVGGGGLGLTFANEDYRFTNNTGSAVTAGDLVQIDYSSISSTDSGIPLAFDKVRVPQAAGRDMGIYGVVLESAAAGARVAVRMRGRVKAQTTGTPAAGIFLVAPAAAVKTIGAHATTTLGRCIAVTLEAGTTSPTWVLFDGINGMGIDGL